MYWAHIKHIAKTDEIFNVDYKITLKRTSNARSVTKSRFTRQKNWVQTSEKSGTDCIILAVYTDNDLQRVGQKVGEGPRLEGCVYATYFEVRTYF